MSDCQTVDALITPLIDGELSSADREKLERHLRVCAPCHSRVEAEKSVRALIHDQQRALKTACAPVALRVKCAAHCTMASRTTRAAAWTRRAIPLAAAAAVLLGVGVLVWYQTSGPSVRVMAMELATDHVKCFEQPGPRESLAAVQAELAREFGWQASLSGSDAAGLELIGARQCLLEGRPVAHVMFTHDGEPMSVFMIPKASYTPAIVEAMGQQCAIWSSDQRTFVLVSREPRASVERVAARVQPTFH